VIGRFISDALLKKLALGTKIAKIFYSLAFIVIGIPDNVATYSCYR